MQHQQCTSWMRAVRSCGTQMCTSVSASLLADPAAAVAGQRDHGHVLGARRVDRGEHVGGVAAGRHRQQHVAGRAERLRPAWRRSPRSRSRCRRRSGSRCRRSARSPPARAARARSGRRTRPRSAGRRAAEPPLPQASTLPPPVMQPTRALTASAIGLREHLGGGVLEVGAVEELLLDALFEHGHGSYDTRFVARFTRCDFSRLQPASNAARSHSMRSPSTATTSKRQGGSAGEAAQEVAAPRSTRRCRLAAPTLAAAPPKRRVAARPHLDEDQRAVAVAHDQVDLAAARARPARDPIIAPHQHQPGRARWASATRLGAIAQRLGRPDRPP